MGVPDADMPKVRQLKQDLKDQVLTWFESNGNTEVLLTALGELTAETALALIGKHLTVDYLHELCGLVVREQYDHPFDAASSRKTSSKH